MRTPRATICWFVLLFAAVVLCRQETFAFGPVLEVLLQVPSQVANGDKLVMRTYDLTDLVVVVPDYPAQTGNWPASGRQGAMSTSGLFFGRSVARNAQGGGGEAGMGGFGAGGMEGSGMMGGGMDAGFGMDGGYRGFAGNAGAVLQAEQRTPMSALVQTIMSVCAPDSWDTAGDQGHVEALGHVIVVRQTQEVHGQIDELLQQLRKGSGRRRTVSIDARWLLLDSGDLDALNAPTADGKTRIDRKRLQEYSRRPSSIRSIANCFSGQLIYLTSGTRQNVIAGFIPVVGSIGQPHQGNVQVAAKVQEPNRFRVAGTVTAKTIAVVGDKTPSVGYQPIVANPNIGALLEIRPTLVPDNNTAIVDVRSTMTMPGKLMAAQDVRQTPLLAGAPTIDRVAIDTQQFATTLSVPLGQPVLIGGMTYLAPSTLGLQPVADAAQQKPPVGETPQLYLVLEVNTGVGG